MTLASIRTRLQGAAIASAGLAMAGPASAHPLDGLSAEEIGAVVEVLKAEGRADENSLYPLIALNEPDKSVVLAWKPGDPEPRAAVVNVTNGTRVFKAVVDIAGRKVVSFEPAAGEPMLLFGESPEAAQLALADPEFVAALARRGLKPDDVSCGGTSPGAFGLPEEQGHRVWRITCGLNSDSSNGESQPVEGLYATLDLRAMTVLDVVDSGIVPVPQDGWGYTENEIAARPGLTLRPEMNPATIEQPLGPNYRIDGSLVAWDMWRFRYRVDQRAGVILSLVEANDGAQWRSVLYQAHLSEVFVPYMDPSPGWYWRTFMDAGELGFGAFLSMLRPGVDCPEHAAFLSATLHKDDGSPRAIRNAICLFERENGDPAWRHAESPIHGTPKPTEGRPAIELVLRSAARLGNYDYLMDYVFRPDGSIDIRVGSAGIDEPKAVASVSMADATAADDTRFGTLIAPNLVAPNHDHYFNFRLDFDVDGRENGFMRTALERMTLPDDSPRRSLWRTSSTMPTTELAGRYKVNPATPAMYHVVNMNRTSCLGHHPGYMILPNDSVAYSLLDTVNDPPAKRNAYIEYTIWNTPYDADERYAGGEYATQSDGSDGLAVWVEQDRTIHDTDIVTWYTIGFHHVPHMEDWPVMSTTWRGITLMPFNFFCNNPAITLRGG